MTDKYTLFINEELIAANVTLQNAVGLILMNTLNMSDVTIKLVKEKGEMFN